MAVAVELETTPYRHVYELDMRIPDSYASQSKLYLTIIPVWITKNENNVARTPMDPPSIGGIARRVVVSENKWMQFTYNSFDDLDNAVPSESYFLNPTFYKTENMLYIKKEKEDGEPNAYEVSIENQALSVVKDGGLIHKFTQLVGTFSALTDSLDDLASISKSIEKFNTTGGASILDAAGVGAVIATDGVEAFVAFQDGDEIKGTLYTTKTALGVLKGVFSIQPIAAKSGTLKALGGVKGQAVLAAAIGTIQVSINLYEASQTNDDVLKSQYYESASGAAIDATISAIPWGWTVTVGWAAIALLANLIPGVDLPLSAGEVVTFAGVHFIPTTIPSVIANKAYEFAAGQEIDRVNGYNELDIPAVWMNPSLD
ncbi:hypothetical protein DRO42_08310 [Candidatus Bathyarchaeota archaeon]|nr:MAG: hypothetical protein DRO42_08310 [Candidatus Bathyarchaeota archaeon]